MFGRHAAVPVLLSYCCVVRCDELGPLYRIQVGRASDEAVSLYIFSNTQETYQISIDFRFEPENADAHQCADLG